VRSATPVTGARVLGAARISSRRCPTAWSTCWRRGSRCGGRRLTGR
jgi:hypothetical protein